MKSLFRFLVPIIFTLILSGIGFIIQFSQGANLAYFKVNWVVDSGIKNACQDGCSSDEVENFPRDCYYYGWCFVMAEGKNIVYIEYILLLFFLFFSVFAWLQWGKERIFYWAGLIVSYWIYFFLASFEWFYNYPDLEIMGFYIIQIIFSGILFFCFFLSYFLSYLFRRKKKPTVNSWEVSSEPSGSSEKTAKS